MKEGTMMITVSVMQLVDAIKEADVYRLPDMNEGTRYLYKNLYTRLANGDDVMLSSLNFDAFDSEDIDSISDMHSGIFARDHYAASSIMSTLRQVAPVSRAVGYV